MTSMHADPSLRLHRSLVEVLNVRGDMEFLRGLVDLVRPTREQPDGVRCLDSVIAVVAANLDLAGELHDRLRFVFHGTRFVHSLAESGIVSDKGLWHSLRHRIEERLLPEPLPEHDLRSIIRGVFDQPDDADWLRGLEPSHWVAFSQLVVRSEDFEGPPHADVAAALLGLTQRVGALGIDEELNAQLHEVEDYDSPFLRLTHLAAELLEIRDCGGDCARVKETFVACVRSCRDLVLQVRSGKQRYGTSVRLTAVTRRLLQQLRRIELLLHLVHPRDEHDFASSLVPVLRNVVLGELRSRSVAALLRDHLDLVAHQITEHTAKKGAKYVSQSPREYWAFLRAAMVGGAIVAVFATIKTALSQLALSQAADALLYSLNYAACFVLIYLTGSILATKQPAVTASTIAKQMDLGGDRAVEEVADTVVRVWRSQFVSFVGNLICAFPAAMAISWTLSSLGFTLAGVDKADKLIADIHPFESGALVYAGVAGGFLFLAGVITGWVDNQVVYRRLAKRLYHSPWLGGDPQRRERVAAFITDNLGVLTGNVMLGFFLGSAGVFGTILGLPFDIRHIAFSSAHFGVAVHSAPALITLQAAIYSTLGVFAIGFVNFVVSFGLTLMTTLESRQVGAGPWRQLTLALGRRLVRRPIAWFLPI